MTSPFSRRWMLAATAYAALAAAVAHAQDAPPQFRLHGNVVDAQGAPAGDVELSIVWYDGERKANTSVASGADGAFDLTLPRHAARGRILRAKADGGAWQTFFRIPYDESKFTDDPLRLELAPARRVEAHVTNADAKAVEDATVGVMSPSAMVELATTDADGHAVLWAPEGTTGHTVFAFSRDHGIDYHAYVLRRGEEVDAHAAPPQLPAEPIKLTLVGGAPVRVRVTEQGGGPLAEVSVYPWLLEKPDEPEHLNLSYFSDLVQAETDEDGVAAFPWLPGWQDRPIEFWPTSADHVHARGIYDPLSGDGTLELALDRVVLLSGRVTTPDGAPAAGVRIDARGMGRKMYDDFQGSTVSDAAGRYEIKAAPNMVYLVTARDDRGGAHWAAEPQTGFALFPGQPRENVDFQLRPATRLFGHVLEGPDDRPVANQRIELTQYGVDAESLPGGVVLPNPTNSNIYVRPMTGVGTMTDAEGRYELFVGPGSYYIHGPTQVRIDPFDIDAEQEREINFESPRRQKGVLRGLVVVEDAAAERAAGAKLRGIYRSSRAGRDFVATADDQGKFEVERELHLTVVHATSADGELGGVAEIGPNEQVGVVVIRPMTTATGRLVDRNGQPMAGRLVSFSMYVHDGPDDTSPFSHRFGDTTTTDADGRFHFTNVMRNVPFHLSVSLAREGGGALEVADFNAEGEGDAPLDLGDVVFDSRRL
jgi:hypothetical protein